MNLMGVIIGAVSFLIIGIFHPIVIKTEYYIGKKAWPIFLAAGIALLITSLLVSNSYISTFLGVVAFSSLWSIKELFEQEKRVERGWFPKKDDR